jgi:aminomethyltransferase
VYRQGEEDFLVVCNASNRHKIDAHFRRNLNAECDYSDESDTTALLALQGPRSWDVLRRAEAEARVLHLERFGLCRTTLAGANVTVARTGYTGEDGVEVFCATADAVRVWRAVLEAGSPVGLVPVGLGARDTLRLEARLCLYGNDIDETTHPYEAGLGWVVKLDKAEFIGKEALTRLRAAPLPRRLVGFEMRGRGIARHGHPILDPKGPRIGTVTSGSPGPTVQKNIGLGYVPLGSSTIGTNLTIDIRGKHVEAVVVKTPFYSRTA